MNVRQSQCTILVLRHHGLGDLVVSSPVLKALRRTFPRCRIISTCPSWLMALAIRMNTADEWICEYSDSVDPAVSKSQYVDPSQHQSVDSRLLDNVLRTVQNVDMIVCLRTPGAELIEFVNRYSPTHFVCYRHPLLPHTREYPELNFSEHILSRWSRLVSLVNVHPKNSDIYLRREIIKASEEAYTVVHIGAGSPSRCWPVENWVEVVEYLRNCGHSVVFTGSRDESTRVQTVVEKARMPESCNQSGSNDVIALASTVAKARLVVSVDSGIAHLATAFNSPALTLFGPVPPMWWGPPPSHKRHWTIWHGQHGNNYGDFVDPGLLTITPREVIGILKEIDCDPHN